jgi:hypothetical protein
MSGLLDAADARRILLLSPPLADTAEAEEQGMLTSVEPFGLLRLGTYFRDRGCDVTLLDCLRDPSLGGQPRRHVRKRLACGDDGDPVVEKDVFHFGLDASGLEQRLAALPAPDVIAVSSIFTWHAEPTREAIAVCRRVVPGAKILLGGNFSTLCPEVARSLGADEVVTGDVPGAEFLPTAIDLLAGPPDTDFLRMIKGCPHQCSYCVTRLLGDGRVQTRAPEAVFAEMMDKHRTHGTRTFVFYDDFVLYQQHRHLNPFLDLVAEERPGVVIEFALGFAAALVDEALARRLRAAGVQRAVLALETTSEARGRSMGRPQSLAEFERAVRVLRDHGFSGPSLRAFYLVGLPGQTTDEILRALIFLYRLGVTPSLTTYTLTPRSGDVSRYGQAVAGRSLDELAPCLWRFAHAGMRVRELDAIYRYFHERYYPLDRILGSATDDPIISRLQAIAREGDA